MVTSIEAKRAIGYFRVSTTGQAGERHSSLDTQLSRYKDYCKRLNLLPVATFQDIVSGRRDDRKQYQEMVSYALKGNCEVVIVQWLDRFGRNPREILRRYWELEERGISVIATDEDIKEELSLLIRAFMAGAESRKIGERVRANMSKAVSKGIHPGPAPYGLMAVKQLIDGKISTTWELEPTESLVVREMHRLSVEENKGYKSIADKLADMGYRAKGGLPFKAFTVQTILENEAITGTLVYGLHPKKGNPKIEVIRIPGFFPAILSQEEWGNLQKRLAIRRENPRGRGQSSAYLLSGILRCGSCGGPMVGATGVRDNRGGRYRRYACSNSRRAKALCGQPVNISSKKLEPAILEYLGQFVDTERVRELLAVTEKTTQDRSQKELQAVEKRLSEIDSALLKDLDRLDRAIINEAEFTRRNETRRTETVELKTRQTALQAKVETERTKATQIESVPVAIKSFLEDFETMPVSEQKVKLQSILKAAQVFRDGRIELEFRG